MVPYADAVVAVTVMRDPGMSLNCALTWVS